MANNLNLLSQRQLQSIFLGKLIAELGLNDVNPGSVVDIISQAIAQQGFSLYYQIAQLTRLVDIDALSGTDLDNKAFEYGLTRIAAAKSSGIISIFREAGFQKVSTTFYAGSPAAISGQTTIDVNDASNALISTSGTLIIGRGTNNEEEVNYSVAPIDNTVFWRFTLNSALTKDHAVEETVILKQGTDQVILAGTVVIVPPTGVSAQIQFTTDTDVTLLAGEEQIDGVEVTATTAGASGNIPVGAISGTAAFPNPPFAGAQAENQSKFTTGKDRETDDELRDRIKNYIQGISKGVKQAILNAIVGLVDPETAKRVVSASVILPLAVADAVKVYIDDGTGFEPSFSSVGFETVLANSTGGEQRLQISQFPISKAQVESNSQEPYNMSSGSLTLQYQVGNISETITFQPADFTNAAIATAEEITAIINDRSTLLEARTSEGGKFVLLTAKADTNESLQITGGGSQAILNFPTDMKETLGLYLDDSKLSKDGSTALLDSGNQAPYNLLAIGAYPHTLTLVVDGKTANPQTCSVGLSDVAVPAAVTAQEIVNVINRDIAGILAATIESGTKVRIQSLTKLSNSSKLHILSGDLNNSTNGLNMSTSEVVGANGDYFLNRELGIVEFPSSLAANKSVTAGSIFTRGKLRAVNPELYSPANGQTLVVAVDGGADQTITFDNTFSGGKTASDSATFINARLLGATAIVRQVGGLNYLEINTNTYQGGSIIIRSASTGNSTFQFPVNTLEVSSDPNKAFIVSGASSPYDFAKDDSLVVVVDNDIVNNTFSIMMNYASTISSAVSSTVFAASALTSIFPNSGDLISYYIGFSSGANTDSTGSIDTVADQTGGIFRYHYATVPTNFANFAVGDFASFSALADSENNGNFIIVAKGADYLDVSHSNGVNASSQSGTSLLSERRRITAYNNLSGQMTVGSAFSSTPSNGDGLFIVPSTIVNLVKYINNVKITSFSLKGIVEGVNNNTQLQLSSKSQGSDGYIQVTGGNANVELQFSVLLKRGIQAYSYWTGLLKLVHRTIYGDDTQLEAFPGVGAAGITFRILAPTIRQLQVTLKLTLATGVSIGSLQNEIKSAVSGYVNTLGVGDDVIIEQIRSAVIQVPGVVDVQIDAPTANIAIADNEKATVADPDILIG